MGRTLTNRSGLQVAREQTVGVLPTQPIWSQLEPNTFGAVGATISTVSRSPISNLRQRRKGTITDLDSGFEFDGDLTLSHFEDFIEAFVFANFTGSSMYNPVTAVDADSYTVADGGFTLAQNALIYARGFSNPVNNGLALVNTGTTATDVVIAGKTLVVEASPPSSARVEVAGFRTPAGDLDVTDVTGNQVTITSATNLFASPGLNIIPGCSLYFGGEAAINRFTTANNVGYVRVVSIASNGSQVIVDKTHQTWAIEANTTQQVDIYVGRFARNVATDDADFAEISYQFETAFPGLGNPSGDRYEYSKGNYANTLALNMALADKATMSFAFVGTDTDPPTSVRATNASTGRTPIGTSAFNTTSDCARLRIAKIDETGLTTDFKTLTLNVNNNVSPEKVLCVLGAKFMNFGNFEIDIETQVLFTNEDVVSAIRNNETVSLDFGLSNDDGAIYFDIPSMTLGDGSKEFPVDQSVLINLSGASFIDPTFNTSFGVTIFPFIPST